MSHPATLGTASRNILCTSCLLLAALLASCGVEQREAAGGGESPARPEATTGGEDEPRALQYAWMRLIDPPPTALTIMPIADATRLQASWNFEMREMSRRLIPAWMAIGGEPGDVTDRAVLYPYLSQEYATGFQRPSVRTDEELATLARQLKTERILQVEVSRHEPETVARAWLVNPANGERWVEWSAGVEYPANAYEPIFDVQAKLAPVIAADLLNMETDELLAVPDISERLTPEERAEVEAAIADAAETLYPPTYPRVFEAYYRVVDALEIDPKNAELWALYTFIQHRLRLRHDDYETEMRREAMIRMITGGEIAIALAPESPVARYAYGISLHGSGRRGAAIAFARKNHEQYPDSWLDHLSYQVMHWEDDKELNVPETIENPVEHLFYRIDHGFAEAMRGEGNPAAIIRDWIVRDPFAPHLLREWARHPRAEGIGLGDHRSTSRLMAIQGSMVTIIETARQLSHAGHGEEAREMLSRIYDITGENMPDGHGPELFRDAREHLSKWFRTSTAERFAAQSDALPTGSPGWELLLAARDGRHEMIQLLGQDVGNAGPLGRGISYTPWEITGIAQRLGVDGALGVYEFFQRRLASSRPARDLLFRMESEFSSDIGVLLELMYYHRRYRFNAQLVNYTRDRLLDITPSNVVFQRMAQTWQYGADETMLHRIERIKYWEPFHLPSIEFIVESLGERDFFDKAQEYSALQRLRDPADHIPYYQETIYGAWKEGRRVRKEEIDDLAQYVNPHLPGRTELLARWYGRHGYVNEAIGLWETATREGDWLSYEDTGVLADLYQLTGEIDTAVELLERYSENPDNLHSGANALLDIHAIHLRQGDFDKAGEYLLKAYGLDSAMGSFMRAQELWNQLKGEMEQAERAYQRRATRYSSATGTLDYALFLQSQGRYDEAWEQLAATYERQHNYHDAVFYHLQFLVREGRLDEAEAVLAERAQSYHQDAGAPHLQANYYMNIGDLDKALEHGYEALDRAREHWRFSARRTLANIHLRRGELDEAWEHVNYLRIQYPVDTIAQTYTAQVLLLRGELDEAEEAMRGAYNYRVDRANAIMGDILYERGDLEAALEHKRAANRLRFPIPESRWLYEEGRIAAELGREDEAREAWERVVELFGGEYHEFGSRAREGLEQLAGE